MDEYVCRVNGIFAFFLCSVVWENLDYKSPLFLEQLSTFELKEIDILFHSAVAGIIKIKAVHKEPGINDNTNCNPLSLIANK